MRTIFLFLLLSTAAVASENFRIKEFGISITTPDGWIHDKGDTFGYVLRDPAAKHHEKIRVHLSRKDATSVQGAGKLALKSINESRAKDGHPLEVVLSSGPVKTQSGIKGWRSAHGFASNSNPYIVHYFFQHPDGRTFCVCAYVSYDPKLERDYGNIILQTLKFTGR
jgi:hypothetical protein